MNYYENVTIVVAGTMGHTIAVVYALAGSNVRLFDHSKHSLRDAHQQIRTAQT